MRQVGGKSGLRGVLRRRRRALGREARELAAAELVERLQGLAAFRRSARVALYLANDGEIDPGGVLRWCLGHGKRCYAPVIVGGGRALRFAEITARTSFRENRFGIAEPSGYAGRVDDTPDDPSKNSFIDPRELDLVLLPLVGFDRRGNRIGMGGGFYDTTFAFKKTSARGLPRLVGLAHEIQRVERIDADRWDIPISAVVTERRIYRCDAGGQVAG